jgi:hypothetical protein
MALGTGALGAGSRPRDEPIARSSARGSARNRHRARAAAIAAPPRRLLSYQFGRNPCARKMADETEFNCIYFGTEKNCLMISLEKLHASDRMYSSRARAVANFREQGPAMDWPVNHVELRVTDQSEETAWTRGSIWSRVADPSRIGNAAGLAGEAPPYPEDSVTTK